MEKKIIDGDKYLKGYKKSKEILNEKKDYGNIIIGVLLIVLSLFGLLFKKDIILTIIGILIPTFIIAASIYRIYYLKPIKSYPEIYKAEIIKSILIIVISSLLFINPSALTRTIISVFLILSLIHQIFETIIFSSSYNILKLIVLAALWISVLCFKNLVNIIMLLVLLSFGLSIIIDEFMK